MMRIYILDLMLVILQCTQDKLEDAETWLYNKYPESDKPKPLSSKLADLYADDWIDKLHEAKRKPIINHNDSTPS